nr:helix-turn-helix transcriptional regulator [Massilistercora timonensis]
MTIAEARKEKGLSRKDVAEWLEIPYRTITNWENGERQCPAYIEKLIVEKILTWQTGTENA